MQLPQITYAEQLIDVNQKEIIIKRRLERGIEVVKSSFPVMITVHSSAPECRPRHAKLTMKYKHARTASELQSEDNDYMMLRNERPYLNLEEWTVNDIDIEEQRLGLNGSPTKVKKIDNVVLARKESVRLTAEESAIDMLVKELITSHIIG